ncbi:MAG: RNB domain-containing ribonuclease [Ilumatobacter coccineus]|uniref:RNB domain-containing ribonuclease n=1 Tax=Ilumatobacter coccineus TaxID=467094 RepID=A0A2G6KI00_9ACTN|nr:MAG: RNB domain-containing ribonuclease [Ilumatobacter coccineus]
MTPSRACLWGLAAKTRCFELVSADQATLWNRGLDAIVDELDLPLGFAPDLADAARDAVQRGPRGRRTDRTRWPYVTLDPASSRDLDQAFRLERGSGDDLILHYAIADVGAFVAPGDPLDVEAFRRAVTVYLPQRRINLYPSVMSEEAVSLVPNADRAAVVFTVRVGTDGHPRLDGVERALIRNRAKLAYSSVTSGDLPDEFDEFARRIRAAEIARGASRVDFPEQEVILDRAQLTLRFRPRRPVEEHNAALSLATNLAVGEALYDAHTGLFRVMPEVDARREGRLRRTAKAVGLTWEPDRSLEEFERSLPADDPRSAAFLVALRRAGGGASYEPYRPDCRPWHSAIAGTYAHATAPLRRLQDRYVIEAALAVAAGREVPEPVALAFEELPRAMARGQQVANRAERWAVDLAEAVVLSGRDGEIFDAVVIDEHDRGVDIQVTDPAILAHTIAHRVDPGDRIRVRLRGTDPDARQVTFERVN